MDAFNKVINPGTRWYRATATYWHFLGLLRRSFLNAIFFFFSNTDRSFLGPSFLPPSLPSFPFVFLRQAGFLFVVLAVLKLRDPPAFASPVLGLCHHGQL